VPKPATLDFAKKSSVARLVLPVVRYSLTPWWMAGSSASAVGPPAHDGSIPSIVPVVVPRL
jgi:hypothetical protein